MSIKTSGRFEMQPKWNFMWTELVFKSQTGMSSFRLSCERTLKRMTSTEWDGLHQNNRHLLKRMASTKKNGLH